MRHTALAVLLALAAAPALAQDRPPLFPTRDVTVTYRLTGGQSQAAPVMTIAWQAASQTMRLDTSGMGGWMVADHRNQRAFMVIEQARMVMDVPVGQALQQAGQSATATYRRTGSDTVAGNACTVWSFQDGGNSGTACVTADGVMLRAQGSSQGQTGGMEATQVVFGTVDPARFQRPQGFQTMPMPGASQAPRPPAR
jgi:hypothetical protein